MIRIILFLALSYCFNVLVLLASKTNFTFDINPTYAPQYLDWFYARYYLDLFYVVLPAIALLYSFVAKWIFTFNRKVREPKKTFAQSKEHVAR